MQAPTLVVLAAGMGSRFGGLKQLVPVGPGGETIMDYSVHDAIRSGFDRVVFVIRRDFEDDFRRQIGSRYEDKLTVGYAFQDLSALPAGFDAPPSRTKPWGTGHAVLAAREEVRTPLCVINADDFYGPGAFTLQAGFLRAPQAGGVPTYAMVGYSLAGALSSHGEVSRGVCATDDAGMLRGISEHTGVARRDGRITGKNEAGQPVELSGDEPVSMNMWGFTPAVFEQFDALFAEFLRRASSLHKAEFYIPTAVNELIRRGEARVRVMPTDERWCGVTYREDQPQVERMIRGMIDAGRYPARLWSS